MPSTPSSPLFLNMADFAEHLRTLRSQRQLTQVRLAKLLGVSPRVYNRWENGNAVPHFDTIVQIAEVLQVSLDALAGRSATTDTQRLRNPELHQLYQQVDELPDEDQQALLLVIDRLVKSSRVSRAVGATTPKRRRSNAPASR